jgi:50S ribosomal subunit-associated GTPase HflX
VNHRDYRGTRNAESLRRLARERIQELQQKLLKAEKENNSREFKRIAEMLKTNQEILKLN